jgi:hypothetical protein
MLLDRGWRRRRNLEPGDVQRSSATTVETEHDKAWGGGEDGGKENSTRSTTNFITTTTEEASPEESQPNLDLPGNSNSSRGSSRLPLVCISLNTAGLNKIKKRERKHKQDRKRPKCPFLIQSLIPWNHLAAASLVLGPNRAQQQEGKIKATEATSAHHCRSRWVAVKDTQVC